ncbi:metallophosphoesterase [Streptomyces sp. NPDC005963]|uniref:metallophosphoesterase n=1 Tax=Streptomyces sp. NPDC005963 TaxID=3156721 RepID=UPI0033CDBD87
MVEGSMTQGAGQGPVVRTATLRDFRVPPYAQVPVQSQLAEEQEPPSAPQPPAASAPAPQPEAQHAAQIPEVSRQHEAPHAPQSYPMSQLPQGSVASEQPPAPHPTPAPLQPPAPEPLQQQPNQSHPHDVHPGNAVPDDELPEGYTPTERDLPVIRRTAENDTLQMPTTSGDAATSDGLGPLYVVGDVHGYLDELIDALTAQGLIDGDGGWAAGNARLWFLGDFTDRGPDGIGVIDLVMRLSAEAAAAGGYCKALMGNHELLLLGAKRFGDTPVNSGAGTATFQAAWLLNGGQKADMDRLQDVHVQWMARLDAVVEEDRHLLMHSDTTAYLDYGSTIEDVNEAVHEILTRNDADECWDLFRKLTKRFAFRDEGGAQAVRDLLAAYGGQRIVHGHSPIPYLLGEVGTEDGEEPERPVIDGPHVYADGLAIAMDGGVTMAGKLLVVQLPLPD